MSRFSGKTELDSDIEIYKYNSTPSPLSSINVRMLNGGD